MLFTGPFYHILFSRYLDVTKRHFSLDILIQFPDSSDLYSRGNMKSSGKYEGWEEGEYTLHRLPKS